MKCYRFKHIPSGMYWRPSSNVRIVLKNPDGSTRVWISAKTNLSKKGKIYSQKPSWSWINGGYYNHLLIKQMIIDQNLTNVSAWNLKHKSFPFIQSEWILEEL